MTERVGFSQEVVNAFMTENRRECIFTSKLKTNLKKNPFTFSSLSEIDIIWFCVPVCLSKLCLRVERKFTRALHPLYIPTKRIDRMEETLTECKNNSEMQSLQWT